MNIDDISNLSLDQLLELKKNVDAHIKSKKKRKKTSPEERKPSLHVKNGKYLQLEIRDEESKLKFYYIGKIGSDRALNNIKKYAETWPDLVTRYEDFLKNNKSTE